MITGGTLPDAAAAPAALLPDGDDDDDDMIMCCNARVVSLTVPSSVSQQLSHRQLLFSGYEVPISGYNLSIKISVNYGVA